MSSSMTMHDKIENEIWLKCMEAKENLKKVMQKFNAIMEKLDLMQKPIVPNIEHSQLNNSANSDHHHEYNMFKKEQLNEVELEISSHENYSIELVSVSLVTLPSVIEISLLHLHIRSPILINFTILLGHGFIDGSDCVISFP